MAFNEQELNIAKQIREQGGSREDFIDIIEQIRTKQKDSKAPKQEEIKQQELIEQPPVTFEKPTLTLDKLKTMTSGIEKEQQQTLEESDEGLTGFISETGEALGRRFDSLGEIKQRFGKKIEEGRRDVQKEFQEGDKTGAFVESMKNQLGLIGSAFQTTGQIVGSGVDVVWEGLENAIQEFTPKEVEQALEDGVATIGENETVQEVVQSYMNFRENNPETARNIESAVNIVEILPFFKGGRKVIKETIKAPVTVPVKTTASIIRGVTPKNISKAIAGIDDIASTELEKVTKKELQSVLDIAEKSVKDIRNPTPFAKAGEKATQALDEMIIQKKLAGKTKSDALKKVGGKLVETNRIMDKFDNLLADRFNVIIDEKGILKAIDGKIAKSIDELQPFVDELLELRTAPNGKITLENLDALVDNIQASLNQAKLNRVGAKLTTAEKTLNGFLEGDMNRILKKEAGKTFEKANIDFKKALDTATDLEKLLGPKQTRAEGLFKSIFSPQTGERAKVIFKEIKDLTGIDLAQESVLAKFAMEAVGDTRGLNLLESTIQGQSLGIINPGIIQKSLQTIFSPEKVGKSLTRTPGVIETIKKSDIGKKSLESVKKSK